MADFYKKRDGSRRIREELKYEGVWIGRRRISIIMKNHGLLTILPKSYVPKTTGKTYTIAI